jgi:hypothetical protein
VDGRGTRVAQRIWKENRHMSRKTDGMMSGDGGKAWRRKERGAKVALAGMSLSTAGLIFTRLYKSTSQKMVLFITKAKRTSNLEYKLTSLMKRGWDRRNTEIAKH